MTADVVAGTDLVDIGELVEGSGLPASTLHVWERAGVLMPVGRHGIRRQYAADSLERVAMIVVLQRAGFTLSEIAELFAPDAFTSGKGRLEDKLSELRAKQRQLAIAIRGLEHSLACTEPNPLECDGFLSKLSGVLPVSR